MAENAFEPLPGRFWTNITEIDALPISTITASGTTNVFFNARSRKERIERLCVATGTAVPAGGAAITCVFNLVRGLGGATIPLTAAFTLTALSVNSTYIVPLLTTLTDAQRMKQESDTITCVVTAAGTVTTQPLPALGFSVEVAVRQ